MEVCATVHCAAVCKELSGAFAPDCITRKKTDRDHFTLKTTSLDVIFYHTYLLGPVEQGPSVGCKFLKAPLHIQVIW